MLCGLSRLDVEELFDVREALKVFATRRASSEASPEELATLRRILEQGEAAIAGNDPDKAAALALHHVRVNRQIALRILFSDVPDEEAVDGA